MKNLERKISLYYIIVLKNLVALLIFKVCNFVLFLLRTSIKFIEGKVLCLCMYFLNKHIVVFIDLKMFYSKVLLKHSFSLLC